MSKLFNKSEEARIVAAIRVAEAHTTGEIRVHIAADCEGDTVAAAARTFAALKMHETTDRNGVILYIVPSQKRFAIWGDIGINAAATPDFWHQAAESLQGYFRQAMFCEGICAALQDIGILLQRDFPLRDNLPQNELSDDISYD